MLIGFVEHATMDKILVEILWSFGNTG
jgi:hypothetical protein